MILAAAAGGALLVLAAGAAYEIAAPSGHLSEQAATILSTALGAAIGAVATYLGGTSTDRENPRPSDRS